MKQDARVLLAEDNSDDAELLLSAFAAQKFPLPVERVADGAEAIEYLARRGPYAAFTEPPVLVLLDLAMPKRGGLEVLEFMRRDRWLKYVPVVVFSGGADEDQRLSALDLGARFVIRKPEDREGYLKLAENIDAMLSFLH